MTLQEAIEIGTKLERTLAPTMAASGTDAMKLGIEALKHVDRVRNAAHNYSIFLLPGEISSPPRAKDKPSRLTIDEAMDGLQ